MGWLLSTSDSGAVTKANGEEEAALCRVFMPRMLGWAGWHRVLRLWLWQAPLPGPHTWVLWSPSPRRSWGRSFTCLGTVHREPTVCGHLSRQWARKGPQCPALSPGGAHAETAVGRVQVCSHQGGLPTSGGVGNGRQGYLELVRGRAWRGGWAWTCDKGQQRSSSQEMGCPSKDSRLLTEGLMLQGVV